MVSALEKEFCFIQLAKTNTQTDMQRGDLNTTGRTHHEKTGFSTIYQGCGLGENFIGQRLVLFF
jgi:hypothetical protein